MTKIAPSILSADFLRLGEEITAIEKAGADMIHIDVMDGHFVPNLTMGPLIVQAVKKIATIPLDVHLMINNPERSLDAFIDAGANYVTIHQENTVHLDRTIHHITSRGAKAGVALNPSTDESTLNYVMDALDLILVMSVNPGFAAQSFIPSAVRKIKNIRAMLTASNNSKCILSVDGGIQAATAQQCINAGATMLVAGSYIFKNNNYASAIKSLKNT